jgi:uncharacterized membrane protein YdjX (TVP38/TMEM64 family)
MKRETRLLLLRIAALVFVVGLSVTMYLFRERVRELAAFGYPGIFLVSVATNATLILPVPGVLITSMMGAVFNPFWVAIAAGSGSAVGELSGYLAGFSGQGVVENSRVYNKISEWIQKYGAPVIFILALIPNPVFDVAGMIAGMMKMPFFKFFVWCLLGKILKMMAFAYLGNQTIKLIPF